MAQKAEAALFAAGTGALAALPAGLFGGALAGAAGGFANNLLGQSFTPCGSINWGNAGLSAAAGLGAGTLSGVLGKIGQQFLRPSRIVGEALPNTYGQTGTIPPPLDWANHGGILGNAVGTAVGTSLGY